MNKILKACIFILLSFVIAYLFVSRIPSPKKEIVQKSLFVVLLIASVVLLDKKKLAYFGFKHLSGERLNILLSVLGVFLIYALFNGLSFGPTMPSLTPALLLFFLAFLEETFFCGYIQNVLQESLGRMEAILLTALLFCIYSIYPELRLVAELFILRLWLSFVFSLNLNLGSPIAGRFVYITLRLL